MLQTGKHLGIWNKDSTSVKPLIHFEQLEPRILLSADSLLNITPDPRQDTLFNNTQQEIQYAELVDTNEQVEEQISLEVASSDTPDFDGYQPILTLFVDNDQTNNEPADTELSVNNIGPAQVDGKIVLHSNDSNGNIESKTCTNEDGSMPTYIHYADLNTEHTTSIEIRGPPTSGIGGTSADAPEDLIETITTTGSNALVYLPGQPIGDSANFAVTPNSVESSSLINLDTFRADLRFIGIDGVGFATVILDTGIDVDHPFFGPDLDSDGVADRIIYQWDYAYNDSDASDVRGHGSNVSNIVASSDLTYTGMAPGANIIHLKVLDDTGNGIFAWVESAL